MRVVLGKSRRRGVRVLDVQFRSTAIKCKNGFGNLCAQRSARTETVEESREESLMPPPTNREPV